ncbi:hypothetical protein GXW78_14380 [Roseomonas terrae]|jgi:enoyl-CoA hydratase/carnithine racemase|uniref:Enoyl-CoA hydratase n=1 Tax=Neoroseomonas terrae TaxID=424799 RepID=A0ABS5EIK1_9PROT|nr:enoyl-CoA hydratase-related protein [Neoroseomonas terrae]MBR0650856.1 hypothetical protein [Neoroseomonas terrae]
MTTGTIRQERRADGVVTLWLDNPAMRNALNDAMIDALIASLRDLGRDPSCRAIVLRGVGGIFCAGRELNNLLQLQGADAETIAATYQVLRELNEAVYYCGKPTISVLERYALGAGAALATWSDLAIAAEDTLLGYPEVKVGLPPSQTTVSLIRGVPRKIAMDLLLTARNIRAEEALRIGLVSRVAPKGGIDALLEEMLGELLRASPEALARTKQVVWKVEDADYHSAVATAVDCICTAITTREAREGISAFVEKRQPDWAQARKA